MKAVKLIVVLSLFLSACSPYQNMSKNPNVGDYYGGGIVFRVYETKRQIFIIHPKELIKTVYNYGVPEWWMWDKANHGIIETGRGAGAGSINTQRILLAMQFSPSEHPFAAAVTQKIVTTSDYKVFDNSMDALKYQAASFSDSLKIYNDWFLPCVGELGALMNAYENNEGGLKDKLEYKIDSEYWSSSEGENFPNKAYAFRLISTTGKYQAYEEDKSKSKNVLPIRMEYY